MARLEQAKQRLEQALARLERSVVKVQGLKDKNRSLALALDSVQSSEQQLRTAAADALAEVDQAIALIAAQASTEGERVEPAVPSPANAATEPPNAVDLGEEDGVGGAGADILEAPTDTNLLDATDQPTSDMFEGQEAVADVLPNGPENAPQPQPMSDDPTEAEDAYQAGLQLWATTTVSSSSSSDQLHDAGDVAEQMFDQDDPADANKDADAGPGEDADAEASERADADAGEDADADAEAHSEGPAASFKLQSQGDEENELYEPEEEAETETETYVVVEEADDLADDDESFDNQDYVDAEQAFAPDADADVAIVPDDADDLFDTDIMVDADVDDVFDIDTDADTDVDADTNQDQLSDNPENDDNPSDPKTKGDTGGSWSFLDD